MTTATAMRAGLRRAALIGFVSLLIPILAYAALNVGQSPVAIAPSCVSVAGDSAAYGDVVYELLGVGYVIAHQRPVSAFIEEYYAQHGQQVTVYNRSAPAVSISSTVHLSYFGTQAYNALLQDHCPYTVIMPWVNDLTTTLDPHITAPTHAAVLSSLVQEILADNPTGKVLILNYYLGLPASHTLQTFGRGVTPTAVKIYNAQIAAACINGGLALPNVQCLDIEAAFSGVKYLAGSVSERELRASLAVPLTDEEEHLVSAFFGSTPSALAVGDGVHLSDAGKTAIAAYVAQFMH